MVQTIAEEMESAQEAPDEVSRHVGANANGDGEKRQARRGGDDGVTLPTTGHGSDSSVAPAGGHERRADDAMLGRAPFTTTERAFMGLSALVLLIYVGAEVAFGG